MKFEYVQRRLRVGRWSLEANRAEWTAVAVNQLRERSCLWPALLTAKEAELVLLIAPRTPLGDPEATGAIRAGAANLNSHLSSDSKWGQKVPLNGWRKHSPGKGVMVPFR